MEYAQLGDNMEIDYQKKDITKAPKIKKVSDPVLPAGYELYEKRGMWHLVWNGGHEIFTSKVEAHKWLTK